MEFIQFLEPWMIPIIIMICVTLIVAISVIGNIITTSMKKKEGRPLAENKEFINALREFKEDIDMRVRNLEKIASAEKTSTQKLKEREPKKKNTISLELDDYNSPEKQSNQPSKLKNMLNK